MNALVFTGCAVVTAAAIVMMSSRGVQAGEPRAHPRHVVGAIGSEFEALHVERAMGPEVQAVRFEISSSARVFTNRPPVYIGMCVTNLSTNEIGVPRDLQRYTFVAAGPDGKNLPLTEYGKQRLYDPKLWGGSFSVPPGWACQLVAPVGRFFPMTNAGTYTVSASVKVGKRGDYLHEFSVPSGPLTILVRKDAGGGP